jgi:uncharacterized protein YukJ
MTRVGYGVVVGTVKNAKPATVRSPHVELSCRGARKQIRVALNVASDRAPHDVLYLVDQDLRQPVVNRLPGLPEGFTPVPPAPGGLAIDYVRGGLFETSRLRTLPARSGTDNDLNAVVADVFERARRERGATVYVFGQWDPDEARIHDVHMNQGNSADRANDNGVWRDGAMFVRFPRADRWIGIFVAFQAQSFQTDDRGNPIGETARRAIQRHRGRNGPDHAPLGFSLESQGGAVPAGPAVASVEEPGEHFVATELPAPTTRTLRAYAFDPSRGRVLDNAMTLAVPYHALAPGPIETEDSIPNRLAVIDYDATNRHYYKPVDLDDPRVLLSDGLWPSESDARFHQQMVYAVARDTIAHFETALGRRLHWRRATRGPDDPPGWKDEDILTLGLYPHAMRAANAFYSPHAHGILFGYFAADRTNTLRTLPDQPVFTCLSHDVIVHEMTHAIVDGHRAFFIEQTNRDVAAFHEGFSDLAALFRHFTHREVLLDTLQRTGGRLYNYQLRPDATTDGGAAPTLAVEESRSQASLTAQIAQSNPLIEIAQQYGDATGLRTALRSALGTPPTTAAYKTVTEPHQRGSILVAAVFDAFFTIYVKRTTDMFAIYRAGGGAAQPVDLPAPLARMLCETAIATADQFFEICVRALDYCPPVDLTFGEFLRAMITGEVDRDPDDRDGVRDALMQAFRLRGILPDGARFFSEDALCWNRGEDLGLPRVFGLSFGDPNALSAEDRARIAPVLRSYFDQPGVRVRLGFAKDLPVAVTSFHPVFRTLAGRLQRDLVVEVVQTRQVTFTKDSASSYPFRAGATLLIAPETGAGAVPHGKVRWAVTKPMHQEARSNEEASDRNLRQQAFLVNRGLSGRAIRPAELAIDFALVHGGM